MKRRRRIMKESKKEVLAKFHRDNIIRASEKLFLKNGIENTSMDDIAREAGYSKATLYVYFKNKDEIIGAITLLGMKAFLDYVRNCLMEHKDFKSQYFALCYALVDFQKEHPFYFECVFSEINVDLELEETPKVYYEIYEVGEEINQEILKIFQEGVKEDLLRRDIQLPLASFIFWASIHGIIRMSKEKNKYLQKGMGVSSEDFLQYSFELLYHSIKKE